MSLRKRATTAKAQSSFRKTFSNNLPSMQSKLRQSQVFLPEEAHPYGRPNRPGTPVGDVISNYYGEEAEKQISTKYDILKDTCKPMNLAYARGHTRASAMAKSHVTQENFNKSYTAITNKELFKMSKFKGVYARTNTHNGKSSLYKAQK
uniref:Uncharacterized protein n=1 Tax=Strombidium inclinatum TaxID=197538 RepID=A0A7S3IZD9_9SPIT|mmetsp:Transcript_8358/g.12751  ORF Transcript_8358/g.12751 Transcript_8358/m.12751 type:complete len:149 (+) Transcript_8358:216-662(+)